jgi:hypothetical protein
MHKLFKNSKSLVLISLHFLCTVKGAQIVHRAQRASRVTVGLLPAVRDTQAICPLELPKALLIGKLKKISNIFISQLTLKL